MIVYRHNKPQVFNQSESTYYLSYFIKYHNIKTEKKKKKKFLVNIVYDFAFMIFRFKVAGNRIRFFDIIGKVIPGIRVIISKRS